MASVTDCSPSLRSRPLLPERLRVELAAVSVAALAAPAIAAAVSTALAAVALRDESLYVMHELYVAPGGSGVPPSVSQARL